MLENGGPERFQIVRVLVVQVKAIKGNGIEHAIHIDWRQPAEAIHLLERKRLTEAESRSEFLSSVNGNEVHTGDLIQLVKLPGCLRGHDVDVELRPKSGHPLQ